LSYNEFRRQGNSIYHFPLQKTKKMIKFSLMAKSPILFLREVHDELKRVTWPSKKEAINLTLTVIAVSVAVGLFIGAIDFIFAKGLELALGH